MTPINIKATKENYTTLWLVLWQGALDLTPREREVLAAILNKYLQLTESGVVVPFSYKLCFDKESRKEYCEKLGISAYNLSNILGALKEKGAIYDITAETNGVSNTITYIAAKLLPQKEITFKFEVQ